MKFGIPLIVEIAQVYSIAQRVPTEDLVLQLSHAASLKTSRILGIFEDEWKGNPSNAINPYRTTLKC